MSLLQHFNYTIEAVYRNLTPSLRAEVSKFWLANDALRDIEEVHRRAEEIACVVRDDQKELVGVSTVYFAVGETTEKLLHYRMFVRKQDRGQGLMKMVTRATREFLEAHAELREGAVGIAIVAENPILKRPSAKQLLARAQWQWIGIDSRGFDVWHYRFR